MISLEHVNKYFWGASRFKRYYFECRARRKKLSLSDPPALAKSTLIRCMNQLEKVNDGSVVIDNIDITKPKAPIQKGSPESCHGLSKIFNLYAHKNDY